MAMAKPAPAPAPMLLLLSLLLLFQGSRGDFSVARAEAPTPVGEDCIQDFNLWLWNVSTTGAKPHYNFSNTPDDDTYLPASKKRAPLPTTKDLITVAQDGSGDYSTVQDAVDAVPDNNAKRVTIHIKPGTYKEKVVIPSGKPFITFKGDGQKTTIIVWGDTASTKRGGKVLSTFGSCTVCVNSNNFIGWGLTIKNSAPSPAPGAVGEQAVALRLSGDKAALYYVAIYGAQDTLYLHKGTHYISNSLISGSIDFIFGDARALIKKCHIHSIATSFGSLTAQKRLNKDDAGGFSFVGCVIDGHGQNYLGRAWGRYSRCVYSYCYFADIIRPDGWNDWEDPTRQKTVFYGDYASFGPGVTKFATFPKWVHRLTRSQASHFIGYGFIDGKSWLPYLI